MPNQTYNMFSLAKPFKCLGGLSNFILGRSRCKVVKEQPPAPKESFQVTILGGTRPTAQSLALLLAHHPLVNQLVLYDVSKATCGLGLDLSHIPSKCFVEGRAGNIGSALHDSDIVVLAHGVPRKTGQSDYELFKANADSLVQSVQEIAKFSPKAFIVNLTEPINMTVPLTSLILQARNAYNRSKVFGVTGVDIMRAQTCLRFLNGMTKQTAIDVPVICGHSSKTIVPLLSQVSPWMDVDPCTTVTVTEHVRGEEYNVVALKRGSGHSTHLAAYAGYNTIATLLNALSGRSEKHIAFVANNDYKTKYFASPVKITKNGITEIAEYKYIASIEAAYLQESVKELTRDINEAEKYYDTVVCGKKMYKMEPKKVPVKSLFGDKDLNKIIQ